MATSISVGQRPTLLLIAAMGRIGTQFFDSKTKIPLIYYKNSKILFL
jgi:hypothetical protein